MTIFLGAISVLVPDYDAGLAFFVGRLGFDLIEDRALTTDKRWVLVRPPSGGAAILLARAATPLQTMAIGNQAGGRVFLFLESDDFQADHARLVAAGVEFSERPRCERYGWVAVFTDLFGNRWDLVERRTRS